MKYWFICLFLLNHSVPESCRHLVFNPANTIEGQRLINHLIRVHGVQDRELCELLCYMEPNCVSYNLGNQRSGTYICELNNVTHDHTGNKDHLVEDQSYIYSGAEASEICVLCSWFKLFTPYAPFQQTFGDFLLLSDIHNKSRNVPIK